MRSVSKSVKPARTEDVALKTNHVREIDLKTNMDLRYSQLNLIQSLLMIATGIMLLPTIAIIGITSRSPASLVSAISILLQILTVCAVLVACILLSRIESKLNIGGK